MFYLNPSLTVCYQQLQVLVDDSASLQHQYAGTANAEQFQQQQALVTDNWGSLQDYTTKRGKELQEALNIYKFLNSVSSAFT